MKRHGDIDIDVCDRDTLLKELNHIDASMIGRNGALTRHNVGVYGHAVPVDPFSNLCSLTYTEAEEAGFKKVDLLNLSSLSFFKNKRHLRNVIAKDPEWDMFLDKGVVMQLSQISGHYGLLRKKRPRSVLELAMFIALIRPGKSHLREKSWYEMSSEIWQKGTDGYQFKKSHAIAYALNIVAEMNLIKYEKVKLNQYVDVITDQKVIIDDL